MMIQSNNNADLNTQAFRDEWGVDHIINGPHPTQYRGGWSTFDTREDAERFAADPKRLNAKVMHRRVTDWTALASDAGRQG